jgi:hypothetical protein
LFAAELGVDPATVPLLSYYLGGVFKRYGEMFRELKETNTAAGIARQPAAD